MKFEFKRNTFLPLVVSVFVYGNGIGNGIGDITLSFVLSFFGLFFLFFLLVFCWFFVFFFSLDLMDEEMGGEKDMYKAI